MDDYGFNGTPGATLATDSFVKKTMKIFISGNFHMDRLSLLKNKLILRYLELKQIGFISFFLNLMIKSKL